MVGYDSTLLGYYSPILISSSVLAYSNPPTAVTTAVHLSFTGGAMRLGGVGLGCSVAAIFAGTVLAGWAF